MENGLYRPLGSRLLRDPRDRRISELEECDKASLVGVPWDWSTGGDPGARHAPSLIIRSILSLPPHAPGGSSIPCKPRVLGEVAVAGGDWERTASRIRRVTSELLGSQRFTLFVGGDHSITGPILEALLEEGHVGLLMLDAHYDLRSVDEGVTSGSWLWRVAQKTAMAGAPQLSVAIVGVADYANPGYLAERAERLGFRVIPASMLWEGPGPALEAVDWLAEAGADRYYITIDMDHIAEAYAPGVNSPSPLGVQPWVTARILDYAARKLAPRGADIVEVVPLKDRGGATVRLAALLGARLIGGVLGVAGEG